MGITSIGDARTPGRPIEVTFGNIAAQPSAVQTVCLIGHAASGAGSGTAATYQVATINNSGDPVAGYAEAQTKFGTSSELAKMVLAAINANAANGASSFPQLIAVPLLSTDTAFGSSGQALSALDKAGEVEFVVSPYDASASGNLGLLKNQCAAMSGATRVANNQFGTIGVAANRSVTDPSTLAKSDSQFLSLVWLRDTGSPAYSLGELAAAFTGIVAGNAIPFNPLDGQVIGALDAPASQSDWETIGDNAESETALGKGWNPLKVNANGSVSIVRAITSRLSADGSGSPVVTSYFDIMDFQVLYYWRKTLFTNFSQPQWQKQKASSSAAKRLLGDLLRLANEFQNQNMFQAVKQLASQFQVVRDPTDRSTFQYLTPVNVIPGLHRLEGNVQATTDFDAIVF